MSKINKSGEAHTIYVERRYLDRERTMHRRAERAAKYGFAF